MRLDRATGTWYRPADKLILGETPTVYGNVPIEKGDTVLDLGANIGTASRLFLRKGADHVIAVEADPTNIPLLRKNLHRQHALILPAAVGKKPGRTDFYIRADRPYVGSTLADPTRQKISVPVVPFGGLLRQYRPRVVKCDIEFGEYELPELRALPDYVRVLAMEVHIRYVGVFTGRTMDADELRERREAAADLIASFEAQGFREHWRKDKQVQERARETEPPAAKDASGLGPLVKCVCVTYVR